MTGISYYLGRRILCSGSVKLCTLPETCRGEVDAKDLADLFLQWLFRLHGLAETITSDRGTQYASHYWGRLYGSLQIGRRMSTTFHPQTHGQTERFNAVVEQ